MNFGEKLAKLMQENGVSNYKLAKTLSCSQSSVKNWLDGNEPKIEYATGIANFFGVSVDYLLDREQEKPTPINESELSMSMKDQRLVSWFRSLPEEKQKAILILQDAPRGLL